MIQPTRRLAELEARYGRDAFRHLSYADALDLFAALWAEARALQGAALAESDWRDDLEPDLAVARAVNGLPPRA
ncbi:MAG TPA: hypothetical protein VGQ06_15995 [Gemmatimonadales bacterium]|nr:hypothetical protein [Gemmatimonadales bacterium]